MLLAGCLAVPDGIEALLFDLDGVIIDSLTHDYEVVQQLLRAEGRPEDVPQSVIRSYFALALPDFWRAISDSCGLDLSAETVERLVEGHEELRRHAVMPVHAGIVDIMDAARASGLHIAVVSNNPESEIRKTLANISISVETVVGNDGPGLRRKPAPDMYLEGARRFALDPSLCVAIEDSLVGAQAAHSAGCVTVGVATGGNTYQELFSSGYLSHCYADFSPPAHDGKTQSAAPFPIADHVVAASPYIPDWFGLDRANYIRLDRNENPLPLPLGVREALAKSIDGSAVQTYPDPGELVSLLAGYAGVPADRLLLTNGSDQGIDLTLRLALPTGGSMLVARPEFAVFKQVADTIGGRVVGVPYDSDFAFPYEQFAAAVRTEKPDLITFINPNNPTGTPIAVDYMESIIAANPDTAIIVDEAYYEYTGQTVVPLAARYPNLMVLRTFSKAFAMAGLRLGYVIAAPEVVGHLRKLQNPFDVNHLAIVAGIAQLQRVNDMVADVQYVVDVVKPFVVKSLTELGIDVLPGSANFVLVRPKDCDGAVRHLQDSGILVRPMFAPALKGSIRVSLGTLDEMRRFVDVLGAYDKEGVA